MNRDEELNIIDCKACSEKMIPNYSRDILCEACHFRVKGMGGRERIREMVRIRDKHRCQACLEFWWVGERRFDIHHLEGLCGKMSRKCDKVSDMDKLITLCHKCHFNHSEHSRMSNFNKRTNEQWGYPQPTDE